MQSSAHAGALTGAETGHLVRALHADADLAVGRAQFMEVVDVRGYACPERPDAFHLLRGAESEVFDREAVVEARPLPLQRRQRVERELEAEIARAVHVYLAAGMPVGPGGLLELLRSHEPFAEMAVDVARGLQDRELGEEGAIGKHLYLVGETESVGAACPEGFERANAVLRRSTGAEQAANVRYAQDPERRIGIIKHTGGGGAFQVDVEQAYGHVAHGGLAAVVHDALQTFKAGVDPGGRHDDRIELVDRVAEAVLEEMAAVIIDLRAALHLVSLDPDVGHHRAVHVQLVE